MAANFSTLFLLTLLGLGLSFPYHAGQQLASNGMQQRFAHNGMQQRSNGMEQQQPAPMALQQQQPAPMPLQSSNGVEQQSSTGVMPPAEQYLPTESAVIPPPQQTPPIESIESGIMDPIDNETDSTQVIVETLTEAERSHLISYFLCEMCRELQVSMCMRICNGEETDGSGSGAEIEGSGAETESSEGSGQDGGDTVIIVVEESSSSEGSGQESSNNGNGAEASGNEGSGEESEASGDN
jgi:hypothetical protein